MKNIKIIKDRKRTPTEQVVSKKSNLQFQKTSSFSDYSLPPMWAKVLSISGINHVDVELVNGMQLKYVPVVSSKWVKKNEDNTSTGRKDLPSEGSKVLIIFIDGIMDNAFVLCSGFDALQSWQKAELLKEGEEDIEKERDNFGWFFTKNKSNGEIKLESPSGDNQVSILIDLENTTISITQKTDSLHSNSIVLDSSGFTISDNKGNTIASTASSVQINGSSLEVLQ